ncbi:hypothetical protein VC83_01259 [Pseudogymnoascus destructans]|nr:uncharacterized protein VC83_01259 [Pseudogymnoascus destructans]OAF62442.1 hypothetical protein VC83_01259 [Pseudogymnoascus destructans]
MRSAAPKKAVKMPYNTRRKSLSLPSLGIHLPVTHASRAATAAAAANRSSPTSTAPSDQQPPLKKIKQSHASSSSPSSSSKPLSHMSPPSKPEPAAKSILKYEHTPPPSPEADAVEDEGAPRREIDLEGINDDIVEAVIVQLQRTANRPHLVKELAAILSTSVKIVETSANPSAIISSRLSTYLKRSCWSALAPCPLAKELETVHPRRTYFYLTTYRHQPIPSPSTAASSSTAFPQRSIISPSLSSTESRSEDDVDAERRRQLSPSPEVDLSSPELDDAGCSDSNGSVAPPTPSGSFSGRLTSDARAGLVRNHRAASPPLEKDEKEFTQTARGMQRRQLLSEKLREGAAAASHIPSFSFSGEAEVKIMDLDGDGDLFGEHDHHGKGDNGGLHGFVSSPAMKPVGGLMAGMMPLLSSPASISVLKRPFEDMDEVWTKDEMEWDSRSPENIDLEELDGMFDCFE